MLLTIRSTEDGYSWQLHDGPDGAFTYSGHAPLLETAFADVLRAQWALAEHLTADLNPEDRWLPDPDALIHVLADDTPDPAPVPQLKTPDGHPLPAHQDIPAAPHPTKTPRSL